MAATRKDATSALAADVARQLRALRKARGFSTEELATELGIAVQNYRRIESGKQNLTLRTIERIAKVLDAKVEVLLRISEPS